MAKEEKTTLVTPTGRAVFLKNLFEPDEKGKYKLTMIFNKDQNLKPIIDMMRTEALKMFSKEECKDDTFKWGLKAATSKQIRKYDFMTEDTMVLNASTKFPISVKGINKGVDGKLEELFSNDIVAGDYVRAIVSAFAFDTDNNQGVSLNVNGVQKLKNTEEPLYQPTPVDEVFSEVSFDIDVQSGSTEESSDMEW